MLRTKNSLKAHESLHLCKTQKSVPRLLFLHSACGSTNGALCRSGREWAASEGTAAEGRAFHSGNTYKARGTEKTSDMSCAGET